MNSKTLLTRSKEKSDKLERQMKDASGTAFIDLTESTPNPKSDDDASACPRE